MAIYSQTDVYHGYPTSLLQHVLSQAVYITQVNIIMADTIRNKEWDQFYFILGRMLRSLIIVVPLEKEEYENGDPLDSAVPTTDDISSVILRTKYDTTDGELTRDLARKVPLVGYEKRYRTADEMDWFWKSYYVIKGLGDKTIGHGSTYRATFCYFNLRDIVTLSGTDVPTYAVNLDFNSFVTSITDIFTHVDPLFKECTAAYEEYYVTALEYGTAFSKLMILALNFAYHLPELFRVVDSLVRELSKDLTF